MTQSARLNRSDLAKKLFLRLTATAGVIVLVGLALFPTYSAALLYGVLIFLANFLIFAFYAFRYSGSRAAFLMLQGFARGVFFKLMFFALVLVLVYRFDENTRAFDQSAVMLGSYLLLQVFQIVWSVGLSNNLNPESR